MAEFIYSIEKDLRPIGTKGKALRLVCWGGRPARLDLRQWRQDGDELKPGKGITLSDEEAQDLLEALRDYLCRK